MRKISIFLTVLITSLALTLAGLVASPIAAASENGNGSISATFPLGSSVLTKDQKAAIKKALASSGTDATFIVTGTAGKLPGVNDRWVQRLAKARAKAIKAYLVSLGVSETSITTEANVTNIGVDPSSVRYPTPAPTPTPTVTAAAASTGSGSSSGGGGANCALGGTCIVGDRGPGGGIVFYVSAANFASVGSTCNTAGAGGSSVCKYLEVAPATWESAGALVADDTLKEWARSSGAAPLTGQDLTVLTSLATESGFTNRATPPVIIEQENWKIGKGHYNTSVMNSGGAASTAQAAVLAYAGNSTAGEWFIPSMNELNELCKYARGQTTGVLTVKCTFGGTFKSTLRAGTDLGGFREDDYYYSSSEYNAMNVYVQFFAEGSQYSTYKTGLTVTPFTGQRYVRPVRAF